VDWYTGIPLDEHAVPKYLVSAKNRASFNPAYRGEAFLLESGDSDAEPVKATIEPNQIRVQGALTGVPRTLIVNQNYDRDWHASGGTLFEHDGLLAVALQNQGPFEVRLHYRPRAFYAGLVVSLCSLVLLLWICWTVRSGRLSRWAQAPSSLRAMGSRWLLWLIG
jgi:hypothetical protein